MRQRVFSTKMTLPVEILLLLLGTVGLGTSGEQSCEIRSNENRFDCHPEPHASEQVCYTRGCCWKGEGRQPGQPHCFFPTNVKSYEVLQWRDTKLGHEATLVANSASSWPNSAANLTLEVWYETQTRLHFKISDPRQARYEVPLDMPPTPFWKAFVTDFVVEHNASPFGLKIKRKSTGAVLFDTINNAAPLIFADQFLQITTFLSSPFVYGVGERQGPLMINASTWSKNFLWARDDIPRKDGNLYGAHPFYMNLEKDGNAHGVFFLNSNAMEFLFQPDPALTLRTIGGVLDFYIFSGPSPEDVVRQYVQSIGLPTLPPYWALGFHLCKYDYGSLEVMKKVSDRTRNLGIPHDAQWADIDYMDEKKIWTYDEVKFAGLPEYVADLQSRGQKFVVIVDPGVGISPGNFPPYDKGLEMNVFIKNASGGILEGKVWPGLTVFPDFTHPNVSEWWYHDAQEFRKVVPYDGLWIDMNEPANFVDGSTSGCTTNHLDRPPYTPGFVEGQHLEHKTICPSARHHLSSHYNLHNLYGHFEAKVTDSVLKRLTNKRSFVLSRSTFAGTGKFAFHWTGDIKSSWEDMYYSIPTMLSFQFFGMPFVGADVCGFREDTTEELCIRWMQLGAFYPFMRNHNEINGVEQDPGAFGPEAQRIMKQVVELRYSFLPFFYTQIFFSHSKGGAVVKPLFFLSPRNPDTYSIDKQFMWGDALLITPVLNQGATTVQGYFDEGLWYDVYTGKVLRGTGSYHELEAPLDKINVHLRGGSIVPRQDPAMTTAEAKLNPFKLLVGLNERGKASGFLCLDDGESLDVVENLNYLMVDFDVESDILVSVIYLSSYMPIKTYFLSEVVVYGVQSRPASVLANGAPAEFSYDDENKSLHVTSLHLDLVINANINWSS